VRETATNYIIEAIRTSDGTLLWSTSKGSLPTVFADGQNGFYSLDSSSGITNIIYYNSSYEVKWQIPYSFSSGSYNFNKLVHDEKGWLYGALAKSISGEQFIQYFALAPWSINTSTDASVYSPGGVINFTVNTSMLPSNLLLGGDNKIQVVVDNGDKVALAYSSTDSNGNTIWTGSYTIPLSMTAGSHTYTVEAGAANIQTDITTNFETPATNSNNTGITTTGTFEVIAAPVISSLTVQTPGSIEKYAKFEISFNVSTAANNMYFPYDENTPSGVESKTGISVDALLLPPGETNWGNAKTLACFYYQPMTEMGSGSSVTFSPTGNSDWRCRFSPDIAGTWQYKIRARDANGTGENSIRQFTCIESNRKGFVKVSQTDPRFFEFSNGTSFVAPLINVEEGSPFNSLAKIRINVSQMGNNGVRFIRWFPTGEGANYYVVPFGDDLKMSWAFGSGAGTTADDADTLNGKLFSYAPYYYTSQDVPALAGAKYKLSFRAKIAGEQVLRAQIGTRSDALLDICSSTSTFHESKGYTCSDRNSEWKDYSLVFTNSSSTALNIAFRGLYMSSDAPSPFNTVQSGKIRFHSAKLQRDETGNNGWGPNLLARSDPDTYNYVDQINAARLDEIISLSEQSGVYHKLTVFHKNDAVLNRFQTDGSIGSWYQCGWGSCPNNFYSAPSQAARWYENAYTRYFIARWSYSPAIHSLEIGNENDLSNEAYSAGFDFAEYVDSLSPRHILMTNSFWGWWVSSYWTDPAKGYLMDYSDKHWYANTTGSSCDSNGRCELISKIWDDSAAYQRECYLRFKEYQSSFNYNKPIVRGEGGDASSGTSPQNSEISQEPQGLYYHKKTWAHVGTLGYSCDGEWYPRLFVTGGSYPNSNYDTYKVFAAYEKFIQGEPLANGNYDDIGTDLTADNQILVTVTAGTIRAWGTRDTSSGRVLLWIDNANQTWKKVFDGVSIPAASGTLTIQGLTVGNYSASWWDTRTGTITKNETYTVGTDGKLTFPVNELNADIAVKFIAS